MNIRTFYDLVMSLSGLEQSAEAVLDIRTHRLLKTALELADSHEFRSFAENLGTSLKEYLEGTSEKQIKLELKTAIALKQRLG